MSKSKDAYRDFAEKVEVPLQLLPWWWDAICGDSWEVALAKEENGEIIGALPYQVKSKAGFKILTPPPFITYNGPFVKYPADKTLKEPGRIAFQKKVYHDLIEQLPVVAHTALHFHINSGSWLPFYWNGFQQTSRYTYIMDLQQSLEEIESQFKQSVRTDLRKAEDLVNIEECKDINLLYQLAGSSFKRQGLETPFSFEILERLFKSLEKNNAGKLWVAFDKENQKPHAALLVAWNGSEAHALVSGQDADFKSSPAIYAVFHHAINFLHDKVSHFDLEGSMIENVEHFLRGFGGKTDSYHRVTKYGNPIFKIVANLLGR
ncbi:MAG: GNAT family N-acetyltransferase [Saprospiraceae bacterium]